MMSSKDRIASQENSGIEGEGVGDSKGVGEGVGDGEVV